MEPSTEDTAGFYDSLAAAYHRLYPDWEAACREQGDSLHGLLRRSLGDGPHRILDAAVGIGTQLIGLAGLGHQMAGSDLSRAAVRRAARECRTREINAPLCVADMRRLPWQDARFDVALCADNALAHLLTADAVAAALREMCRITRPGGVVVVSVRDYDEPRRDRLPGTLPQVSSDGVAFQVWTWRPDGARYDLEHFTLTRQGAGWQVQLRRTAMWAIIREELDSCARAAGLEDLRWGDPHETGFFQPTLVARVPG